MKKITTLIPAYKTEYLGELFIALKQQTYKNFNIILSDDSPGGKITELLQSDRFKPIIEGFDLRIIQGPRQGGLKNFLSLLNAAEEQNEILHVLLDDDVIYPRFYEYHIGIHQTPGVACSISQRWTATANGLPIDVLPTPAYVQNNMTRAFLLDPELLFKSVVPNCNNWLGEVSNCVFSKEAIPIFRQMEMGGISYAGLGDIGFLLQASISSKVVFIQDYLGFFRLCPNQHTAQPNSPARKASYLAWCAIAAGATLSGNLSREEAYETFKTIARMIRSDYPQDAEMQQYVSLFSMHSQLSDALIKEFRALWNGFLQTHDRL